MRFCCTRARTAKYAEIFWNLTHKNYKIAGNVSNFENTKCAKSLHLEYSVYCTYSIYCSTVEL